MGLWAASRILASLVVAEGKSSQHAGTEPSQIRMAEVPIFRKPPPGGSRKGDRPQKLQIPGSWARGWAGVLCGALQSDSHEQSGGE